VEHARPPYNPPPPAAQSVDAAGFFQSLFDFSFRVFITPKIVKVLYILAMIGIGLACLVFIISAFARSAAFGAFMLLIGAPLLFLIELIFIRVYLELAIALFRIAENTSELVKQGQRDKIR
jgi:Domain of unknown function (DUF4282)